MANPLPETNVQYLQGDYWNNRFQNEQQYDWFKDFNEFKHLCVKHLRPDDSILILGCGNSTLTQDLYNNGFINLTSTDLSDVVIHQMHNRAAALHQDEIKWQVSTYISHKSSAHHNQHACWQPLALFGMHFYCTSTAFVKACWC